MRIRPALAASLVALSVAAAAAQVRKAEVPGVVNFSRVDATVGCGGATAPAAMIELKKHGFASVINLRLASERGADVEAGREAAQAAGLKYIHLPFDASNPDPSLVDSFLSAVADTANQPVYIHCASANRVGAVWMIKRALQDGWPVDKARAEAEAIGLSNARLQEFATGYIARHQR